MSADEGRTRSLGQPPEAIRRSDSENGRRTLHGRKPAFASSISVLCGRRQADPRQLREPQSRRRARHLLLDALRSGHPRRARRSCRRFEADPAFAETLRSSIPNKR
ncbi:MAG: hypothetical protein MZU97_00425 [Bacillus subtilis]|nr:hypothetical protein [Bacillus subtilis]